MGKRIAVVYNPSSRNGRQITRRKIERLADKANATPVYMKRLIKGEDFSSIFKAAIEADPDILIVAGGDGTIREAVEVSLGKPTPLLIWPTGTANILAKNLALKPSDEAVFELINEGETKSLNVGVANGNVFTVGAAIGISTKVFENLKDQTKSRLGSWAYLAQGVVEFSKHKAFTCTLKTDDGKEIKFNSHQVTVLNGNFAVSERFSVFPEHNVFKKSLMIHTHADDPNKAQHLANAIRHMQKGHTGEYIKTWEVKRAVIDAVPAQVVALDAEIVTKTPIKLEISKDKVQVIVPKSTQ